MTDSELLRRFVDQRQQEAFAQLVRRHVNLVYAAALRHVRGDCHRAEDITQEVFIDLARKAAALSHHPSLAGWLYASAHFAVYPTAASQSRGTIRIAGPMAESAITGGLLRNLPDPKYRGGTQR